MNAGVGADRVPGLFINTLPVRVGVGSGAAEAVAGLQRQLAGLLAHEHAPLALAQQASGVTAPAPLFTTVLNYRHAAAAPARQACPEAGLADIEILFGRERTNYPVTVSVDDFGSGFGFSVLAVAPIEVSQVCGLLQVATAGLVRVLEQAPTDSAASNPGAECNRTSANRFRLERHGAERAGDDPGGIVHCAGGPDTGRGGGGMRGRGTHVPGARPGVEPSGPASDQARGRSRVGSSRAAESLGPGGDRALGRSEGRRGVPAGGPGLPGRADRVHAR